MVESVVLAVSSAERFGFIVVGVLVVAFANVARMRMSGGRRRNIFGGFGRWRGRGPGNF